eukprot:Awhi_evm1s8952
MPKDKKVKKAFESRIFFLKKPEQQETERAKRQRLRQINKITQPHSQPQSPSKSSPKPLKEMYLRFFKSFDRLPLFQLIAEKYNIQKALYGGSFVHVTPSFVIPEVVYNDTDKRAHAFFQSPQNYESLIEENRIYKRPSQVRFHFGSFSEELKGEKDESFDLLISQFAGFVTMGCKRYVKKGGYVLVNDSHGDAGVTHLDPDFRLVGVVHSLGEKKCSDDFGYSLCEENLDDYFVAKSPKERSQITKDYLVGLGKGVTYTKAATHY